VVIPYSTIEPIKQKLSSGFQMESDQTDKKLWTQTIQEQLAQTALNVKVDLGYSEIEMADLLALKPGDVIPLNQDVSGEFVVQVEGVAKFKGIYGIHHGSKAIKITKVISNKTS
jgi:flagellar motor switch protein FliM